MNTSSLSLLPDYQAKPLAPAAAASSTLETAPSSCEPRETLLSLRFFFQGFCSHNEENPQGTFLTSSCGARSPPWYNHDSGKNRSF